MIHAVRPIDAENLVVAASTPWCEAIGPEVCQSGDAGHLSSTKSQQPLPFQQLQWCLYLGKKKPWVGLVPFTGGTLEGILSSNYDSNFIHISSLKDSSKTVEGVYSNGTIVLTKWHCEGFGTMEIFWAQSLQGSILCCIEGHSLRAVRA